MSDANTVLEMTQNAQGIYEYQGQYSVDQSNEQQSTDTQQASEQKKQQQAFHSYTSNDLESVYQSMAQRNDEYLKNMRSAFEDSRKRMLDQLQSMTGRF